MSTPWQVLYRLDATQANMQDHIHVNSPCKLTCDALQILNNTQTHKTFLQLKISNPLDVSQTSCAASITLHAHNGQDYVFPQEPLALSLDAHASFEMEPLEISVQDVTGADVYIWQNADAHEANSLESDAIEPAVNPAAGVMPEPAVEPTVNPTADVMPTMVMPSVNNLADNHQDLTAQTGALNSDSTTAQPHTIGYVQAANASVPKQKAQKNKKKIIIISLIVALVCIAAIAAGAFWYLHTQQEQNQQQEQANQDATSEDSSADQSDNSSSKATATLSISCNPSKPFWGIWVYESDDKKDADDHAHDFTSHGFTAITVDTVTIPEAKFTKKYAVTVGTWKDEASTKDAIQALKDAGYGTFKPTYSGKISSSSSAASVTLECVSSTGTTLSGSVRRDANGYVLADSDTHTYTAEEITAKNLTPAELCIAWNEPFARKGYAFSNAGLQTYFERNCPWYKCTHASVSLQGVEAANNELFKSYAKGRGDYSPWLYLKV
ncbi:YARHG domain-containing protein [Fannyhessea vaginae]|uniref:YARHG domain-containing protein n=1 Tax=Fannyhessea vaginae TaxID=82135 RepID=UPI00288A5875|nr:YARHG domain-containing protein [Fannyhessea vaginae]